MKELFVYAIAASTILVFPSAAHAKLAGNSLAPKRLVALSAASGSAAASRLAASALTSRPLGPNRYAANPESVGGYMESSEGLELLAFIVSCALPSEATVVGTLPNGKTFEFFGDLGLATEWIDHPLKKAGRGWVSACLFARVNDEAVPVPISLRGPSKALATDPGETTTWPLEEGAFYGDYFVAPGEPIQWIACRGRDQAAGETGGLIDRDCAEPDPADPTHTRCGFLFAGECSAVCEKVAPDLYYRKCQDTPGDESRSDAFRQVITSFAIR